MTTSVDWPHGVEPMPSIEPSSDLFDGDILGDELIDIYNAAVVGGTDEAMNGKVRQFTHGVIRNFHIFANYHLNRNSDTPCSVG